MKNRRGTPRKCIICDATFRHFNPLVDTCCPDCRRISRTGETMDDLVLEASRIPESLPANNHDYDDFDLEKLINRERPNET